MKRILYLGNLVRGRNSDHSDTPVRWHIAKTEMGDDFTACGLAVEEMNGYDREAWKRPRIKLGGYCTCPECLKQLTGWQQIIAKCPVLKTRGE